MALDRLTKVTGSGIKTDTNWVGNNANFTGITTTGSSFNVGVSTFHSTLAEVHNIKSTGIITATGGSFSGNVTAVDGTFTGNVSIAGTLTYEDVTNIDSVGIITAPALDVDDFLDVGSNIKLGNAGVITATSFVGSGAALTGIDATAIKDSGGNVKIQAQASGAIHSGVSTFQDLDVDGHTNLDNISIAGVTTTTDDIIIGADNKKLKLGAGEELELYQAGNHSIIQHNGGNFLLLKSNAFAVSNASGNKNMFQGFPDTHSSMYYNGSYKIRTQNTGAEIVGTVVAGGLDISGDIDVDGHTNLDNVSIAGVVTATSFVGDGSNLTGLSGVSVANQADNRLITCTGTTNSLNGEQYLTYTSQSSLNLTDGNGTSNLGGNYLLLKRTTGNSNYINAPLADAELLLSADESIIFKTVHTADYNSTERARIDSSGRVLIGTNSSLNQYGSQSHLQVAGTSYDSSTIALRREQNNANPPGIVFAKSRSGTLGGNTIVQNNDQIGSLIFTAADGNDLTTVGAQIKVEVDGTPASNNIPGRIVFQTGGTAASNERLRITSDGDVDVATGHLQAQDIKLGLLSDRFPIIQRAVQSAGSQSLTITGGSGYNEHTGTNHVVTDARQGAMIQLGGGNPTSDTYGGGIRYYAAGHTSPNNPGTGNQHVFYTRSGVDTNTERVRITEDGLVGVGQANPTHMLHVDSSNASDSTATAFFKGRIIRFDGAASAHSPRLNFSLDGTDKAQILLHRTNVGLDIATLAAEPITFKTNSVEKLQLTSQGSVFVKSTGTEPVNQAEAGHYSGNNYVAGHTMGLMVKRSICVSDADTKGVGGIFLSHTKNVVCNGTTYNMMTLHNREGTFVGDVYVGFAVGGAGVVRHYKFTCLYSASTLTSLNNASRGGKSETISVNIVSSNDAHFFQVIPNMSTNETARVSMTIVGAACGRNDGVGGDYYTVNYN